MSGHTPGPWKFVADEFNSHGGRNQLGSIQSRKWFIAVIEGDAGEDANECMANARLIAAAPDLREVCDEVIKAPKEAAAIMEREGFVIDNLTNPWQKLAFTFYSMLVDNASKAEAAIAKAEGKS